jgi:hypothetical protein
MMAAAGHGWGLAVFPLGAAAIAAVFGVMLLARFVRKHRRYEGIWAIALFMFAAASFATFLGVVRGWTGTDFRVYWLLGAVLDVPFLFEGELYLLARDRVWVHLTLLVLIAASVYAGVRVWNAPIRPGPLAGSLPLGKEVFGDHSLPYRLSQFYAFPAYFLLLAGLLWSAWHMRGQPHLRNRTAGTLGIAMGATIVAIGSGVGAGFHIVSLFSAGLAVGIAVMFWGFIVAGRPPAA